MKKLLFLGILELSLHVGNRVVNEEDYSNINNGRSYAYLMW
jgi:hypothetical protein